jgi:tetratricopeptide (TPR) repeat protein
MIHSVDRPHFFGLSSSKEWIFAIILLSPGTFAGRLNAQQQGLRSDVIYMDQPTGIKYDTYLATWPRLDPYVKAIRNSGAAAVEAELKQRSTLPTVSDGELNLLAQLEWQHRELDAADHSIAKAIEIQSGQSLNWFQQAMVDFAHLMYVSGAEDSYQSGLSHPLKGLETWKWQRRTRDAYQRTLDLDTRNLFARYYIAYTYINTPSLVGGDTAKAIKMSDEGIALGQVGFYVVRADAHRARGELDAANADYETAIRLKVIKLGGFLDAAKEELQRKQFDRARRYYEWAIYCRPDSSKAYEGLGDYYLAMGVSDQAKSCYEAAVRKNPRNDAAQAKLNHLMAGK